MNIFFHELSANRRLTIIWICSLSLVIIFFLSIFPSFSQNADEVRKLLLGYPEAVRKALGISLDTISSLPGFYSYIFLYIVLCGSIQGMNLGTSIISKEISEKTADFLLTKPVSRTRILTAKLSAAFVSVIITNIAYLIVAGLMALAVSPGYDFKIFFLISISLFFIQILYLALGVLFSALFPKIKSVVGVSLGTVFTFFIINAFAESSGEKVLRYFTPFQYYNCANIVKNSSYEHIFIFIEIIFVFLALITSYIIYAKRDIDAV